MYSTKKTPNSKTEGQPVYAGSRIIGTVKGDCFYKSIAANGYLQKPRAICFSVSSLNDAERLGATRVQVRDKETGDLWRASIAHIREAGFPVHRAGFEPQIGLSLEGFSRQSKGQPLQAALFEGVGG